MAITSALTVLGYWELPEDDVPPEYIWHHAERLTEWFESVKQRREARSRGEEPIPDTEVDMTSNAYAEDVR